MLGVVNSNWAKVKKNVSSLLESLKTIIIHNRAQYLENFACACVRVRSLLKISRARASAC